MNPKIVGGIALGAALLLGGVEWVRRQDDPRIRALPGYSVYRDHCRKCHGGRGDGPRSSRMADRPVTLASPAFRDTVSAEWVQRVVGEGKGRMKPYRNRLTPDEIDAVTRFVLELPVRD